MRLLLCLGLITSLSLFGCGDDSTPTIDSGGGDDGGSDTGGSDGGGDDGGGSDGGGDDGGGDDGGGDDGGGDDGGGVDAPATDAPMSDGGGRDAPRMDSGSTGTIACGGMTCDTTTQQCCVRGTGGMAACIGLDDSCEGSPITCDGPEDCEGSEVCCFRREGMAGAASCEEDCGGPAASSFELCHSMPDCSSGGDMCCPPPSFISGIGDGYCSPFCIDI